MSEAVSDGTSTNANTIHDNRRKLTDDDIAYIIERLAAGDTQQAIADSLADKVKVDRSRIAQIASQYADRILDLKIQRIKLPVTLHGIEIRCTDARDHRSGDLADLAFFSPPYNVGIEYDGDETEDGLPDDEWHALIREVMEVLRDGWQVSRIVVNVPAALDRVPYRPVVLPDVAGLTLEGVIVWDKGTTGNRTSWGSWRQPTAPRLRDRTERLYVFRTEHPLRGAEATFIEDQGKHVSPLISAAEFTSLTQDLWSIAPESAQRIGHPAPFPVKLAENVIKLYGWPGCVVIDPFAGSGTTLLAAVQEGFSAIGIEKEPEYCEIIRKRMAELQPALPLAK